VTPTLQEAERIIRSRLDAYVHAGRVVVELNAEDVALVLAELDRLRAESQGARVFEGRVQLHDGPNDAIDWVSLEDDDEAGNCSCDVVWFEGLEDRRVRVAVACRREAKEKGKR
jgi:hypothetical protein